MENCFSEGQQHNIDSVVIVLGAVKCITGCVLIMFCISDVVGVIPNTTLPNIYFRKGITTSRGHPWSSSLEIRISCTIVIS
jgi:hypothetical protein